MVKDCPVITVRSNSEEINGSFGQRAVFNRKKMGDKFVYQLTQFTPPAPFTVSADGAKRSSLSVLQWESYEDSAKFIVDFDQIQDKKEVDRFLSPSDYSDVAFVVGGEKIYAQKEILAFHSDYFQVLFFGDFAEKNQTEVVIGDDVTSEEVLALVMLLSRSRHYMISNGNCEDMIRLSDRFGVVELAQECFFFAAFHSKLSFPRRLRMLAKSKDESLIDRFLDRLTPTQRFAVTQSSLMDSIDNDVKAKVLQLGLDSLKTKVRECKCTNPSNCCQLVNEAYDMLDWRHRFP